LKTIFKVVGIGAAGGVRVNVVKDALKAGADILVVGRARQARTSSAQPMSSSSIWIKKRLVSSRL